MRSTILRAAVGAALCLAPACGGSNSPVNDGGLPDSGWQTGLGAALSGVPYYSLNFPQQDLTVFELQIVSGAPAPTCAEVGTLGQMGDSWVLGAVTPAELGTYPVGAPGIALPSSLPDAGGALVYLGHVNPALQSSELVAFASEGAVTVSAAAASESDELSGTRLVGSFTNVAFQPDLVALAACAGDDAGANVVCTCEDLFGALLGTCDAGVTTCCRTSERAVVNVNLNFQAAPCGALCTGAGSTDAGSCAGLNGG